MSAREVKLFTTSEAAAALGIDERTALRWVKTGRLKPAKHVAIGRGVYIFTGQEIARVAALPRLRRGPNPRPPQTDTLPDAS